MAKFCKQCGKELNENVKFCPGCGSMVETQQIQSQENSVPMNRTSLKHPAAKKNRNPLIIFFSIAGIIVLALAAYFILGAVKDAGSGASKTASTAGGKAASARASAVKSNEAMINQYIKKLNAYKIQVNGEALSVGKWTISDQNGTLLLEANSIPSKDLSGIFDLYDSGDITPLKTWAKDVYSTAEEISRKLGEKWSINVGNDCAQVYPAALPSSDLSAYSDSCGYSIPVLSGENKKNLALIVNVSVFGSNKNSLSVQAASGDFIFPNSEIRRLTESDITPLTLEQLRLARNEVYARHGYIFKSEDLKSYFSQKSWYSPNASYDGKTLSEVEKYNVDLIQSRERSLQ